MTAPFPPSSPAGPPDGSPPPPPEKDPDRRFRLILAGVLAFLLIAGVTAAVTAILLAEDTQPAAADEVSLQSNLEPGPDPFTPSVAAPPPTATTTAVPASAPTTAAPSTTRFTVPPASGGAVRSYVGGQPGLYGGTRNYRTCDPDTMVRFLSDNPDKGRAWARVQGIAASDIGSYVAGLTSVTLRTDTWVTNHGFRNGRATTLSSVLQAGTAVMIDSYGVPRVKCFCGNPLTPVARTNYTPRYTGTRWAGFDPRTVVVVQQNITVVNQFTIIDSLTGEPFSRPPGGSGGNDGDVPGGASTVTTTPPPSVSTPATSPPATSPPATFPPEETLPSDVIPPVETFPPPEETLPPEPVTVAGPGAAYPVGDWTLSARYSIDVDRIAGPAQWDSTMTVSAGGGASGEGTGGAAIDGNCYNNGTGQAVSSWHADLSFRVAVTGQSDGQGHLNLRMQKLGATLDSLTYSDPSAPEVQDCRQQAESGYQQFVDDLLGPFTIDDTPGSTASVGAAKNAGTVTLSR